MTPPELAAVRYALARETNPSHLVGFAGALRPEHAYAASLLWARAQVLEHRHELGRATLASVLGRFPALLDARESGAVSPELAAARSELDRAARLLGVPVTQLEYQTRLAASDLVVEPRASFADVPPAVLALARLLVVEIVPGVRCLRPLCESLCPGATSMTTPAQHAMRVRWASQYAREAKLGLLR